MNDTAKVSFDTSENQTAVLDRKKLTTIHWVSVMVFVIRWWSIERVLGLGMLFTAFFLAFGPLTEGTIWQVLANQQGMNITIVSHWYLLSGILLLWKGAKITFTLFLLSIVPMFVTTAASFLLNSQQLNAADIVKEIIINGVLVQRLITKLAVELLEIFGVDITSTKTG